MQRHFQRTFTKSSINAFFSRCLLIALLVCSSFSTLATAAQSRLKLATTTSTDNSGLLTYLLPNFEKKFHISVDVIAVGTGKALQIGKNGDADILLVHAPDAERKFIAQGHGVSRTPLMTNDFVILGPQEDPLALHKCTTVRCAFSALCRGKVPFISRGDSSGTHLKELSLWKSTGCKLQPPLYMEVGQGMGQTLIIASEKKGYCLSDGATYLAFKRKIDLTIQFEGDASLKNIYSVLRLNYHKFPHINKAAAEQFYHWLFSEECKQLIRRFTINGEQVFFPY